MLRADPLARVKPGAELPRKDATMTDYTNMTGGERFTELDRIASQLFETDRWRTTFAAKYGLASSKPVTAWKHNGAPVWALVAVRDALAAKRLGTILTAVSEAQDS